MSSARVSIVVVGVFLSLLLLLSNGGGGGSVEATPFFGFDGNGTSALGLLALAHLQHKVQTLSQLAELLQLGANATQSFFIK